MLPSTSQHLIRSEWKGLWSWTRVLPGRRRLSDGKSGSSGTMKGLISLRHPVGRTALRGSLADGSFCTIGDDDLVKLVAEDFRPLLESFQQAALPSPHPSPSLGHSPSEKVLNKNYPALNQTLVSVLALRWILAGEHDTFVGKGTDSETDLAFASFHRLRNVFLGCLRRLDIYVLVTSVMLGDLSRDPELGGHLAARSRLDIRDAANETIAQHLRAQGVSVVLNRLTSKQRQLILASIRLGFIVAFRATPCWDLDRAQLSLHQGETRELDLLYMTRMLQLAGAQGDQDWTCARAMTHEIWQSCRVLYTVARWQLVPR